VNQVTIGRTAPSLWTTGGGGGYTPPVPAPPTVLESLTIGYDTANNPTSFTDNRIPAEWPAGAGPISRTATYDDAYQLTQVGYSTADLTWTSPFAYEASTNNPGPVPGKVMGARPKLQQFTYDYLGNMTNSVDDEEALFDRSFAGAITYSATSPNQVTSAAGTGLGTAYDAAGNLTGLTVLRTGPCEAPTNACNQDFQYTWDEVGRLASATRWDSTTTLPPPSIRPTTVATVTATYRYSGTERVYQSYYDTSLSATEYTVNIFPSLRLNHTQASGNDYVRSSTTETVYLGGIARVVYGSLPSPSGNAQHIFLELGDPIGSTDIVIDRETSELVERRTEQAFGAEETDYRQASRWSSFREDYRLTGKEDDVAFGLVFFGARYYAPALGRWISPDPLTIHGARGDLNPYAYVGNSPLSHRDRWGLMEEGEDDYGQDADDDDGYEEEGGAGGGNPGGGAGGPGGYGGYHAPPPPPPQPVYGPPVMQDSGQAAAPSPRSAGTQVLAGAKDTVIDNAKIGMWAAMAAALASPDTAIRAAVALPLVQQFSGFLDAAKTPAAQQGGWAYNLGRWGTTALMAVAGGGARSDWGRCRERSCRIGNGWRGPTGARNYNPLPRVRRC
jgi:RHS repeat-associated protein